MMLSLLRPKHKFLNRCICTTDKLKGYIVLVPEIGEDLNVINALIKPDGLPQFNGLTIENCLAAVGKQASCLEQTVKEVEDHIRTNEKIDVNRDVFQKFEDITNALETTWGIAKTLYLGNSTLMPTKYYMNIHERARSARASKFNSNMIYNTIKKCLEQGTVINKEEKRLSEKYILEGKLNGLDILPTKKEELNEILNNLGTERANFKNKINMATNKFTHTIYDYSLVRDFPPDLLESIATDSSNPTKGPWKVSLQPQIVSRFLKYCPNREERWNVWQADVRKASGLSDKSLENSTHVEKIRSFRKRQAQILGFPNFVTMSMETKMIKNVRDIKDIFNVFLKYAGPSQANEIGNLQEFAFKSGFENKLEIYDIPYWQRKQLKSEFDLDEEIIREYFPLPQVLKGLFELCENLFGLKFQERNDVEVWHPSVKFFDVFDSSDTNSPLAGIYIDSYSRDNQYRENAGWMVGIRNKNFAANTNPLASLIFNFNSPIYGKPYLLSISDLQMVFKNFGTALQHLLTKTKYSDLAGLSNIEWDASQVCGHVLMNFLDNPNILKNMSSHYNSGECLPSDLLSNIKMFKTHMSGHKLCKDIYLADLDLELYSSDDFWLDVVKRLWPVYMCMPLDKKDSHVCSMTDIFAGDWSAALYSHLFSRLIAADIYTAFLENPNEEKDVGKRFKESFLSYGGSMSTAEIFRIFRGRDPSPNALLESLNLLDTSQSSDY